MVITFAGSFSTNTGKRLGPIIAIPIQMIAYRPIIAGLPILVDHMSKLASVVAGNAIPMAQHPMLISTITSGLQHTFLNSLKIFALCASFLGALTSFVEKKCDNGTNNCDHTKIATYFG